MKRWITALLIMVFMSGLAGCQKAEGIYSEEKSSEAFSQLAVEESQSRGDMVKQSADAVLPSVDDAKQALSTDVAPENEGKQVSSEETFCGDMVQQDTGSESSQKETVRSTASEVPSQEDKDLSVDDLKQVSALTEPGDEDLVRVLDYIPQIRQELAYATTENFVGQRIYDFTDAYLRYGTVKKLKMVCEELALEGIGLKIWDGFRPVSAQKKLWEICPDETYVSHPDTGTRSHCRGSAVDVTLVDLDTGAELAVPTGFDDFTAYADRDYSDCTKEAAANAILLEQAMEKAGFKPYAAEWWHFSDTDKYPVEEYFDPAVPLLWEANCNEYISLRQKASKSETIAQIPDGGVVSLQKWIGKYAKVTYGKLQGYVMSSYIMPQEDTYLVDCLKTVVPTNMYSYEQMLDDIETLYKTYPGMVETQVIGKSELGRGIPALRIGNVDAEYHVLFQGAIHGREHVTAWLLMAMADYWLQHDILSYGDVCYHIIPMMNPDGVVISQSKKLSQKQQIIYRNDVKNGYTTDRESQYAALWKANGVGVDINRNFPAGWEDGSDRTAPSSQRYHGESPFSSAEAKVLRDYTLGYLFDTTISYHATGSQIYYEYGKKKAVNSASKALAKEVKEVTGYSMEGSSSLDSGGYKDWVMEVLGIPSLTIEVGCQSAALAEREIYSVFVRNYRVMPAVAQWLCE